MGKKNVSLLDLKYVWIFGSSGLCTDKYAVATGISREASRVYPAGAVKVPVTL